MMRRREEQHAGKASLQAVLMRTLGTPSSYAYYGDTTTEHTRVNLQNANNAKSQVPSYGKNNKHGQLLEARIQTA